MAFEDVKDNIGEQLKSVWGRVRETDAFLQLSERYQSLSPAGQKVSVIGAVVVFVLIMMIFPYIPFSGSSTSIEEYESKRDVIRQLFKVNREAAGLPPTQPPVASGELQNEAREKLTAARLAPDQIVSVTESAANVPNVAKTIEQTGIAVSLAKLNLKQIVDIGSELQNLHGNSARMMGLEVKANSADAHYYDVVYKIVAFAAKPEAAPKKGGKK